MAALAGRYGPRLPTCRPSATTLHTWAFPRAPRNNFSLTCSSRRHHRHLTSAAAASAAAAPDDGKQQQPTSPSSLPQPFRENLVGMGQVVFCNSPVSGAIIIGGLFASDLATGSTPWLGAMSVLSLATATAAARICSIDDDMVSNGLASYNGALVGCAFAVFLPMHGVSVPLIAVRHAPSRHHLINRVNV